MLSFTRIARTTNAQQLKIFSQILYPSHFCSLGSVADENEVIDGLHRALVKVKYPGIGDIEPSDLENTVLVQDERNKLLHWLLVESLRAIGSTSDKPAADDGSLVKWYVQLGICDDKAALLGQRQIKHQLETLIRLTRFIMNVLGVNGEKQDIPIEAENILDEYLNTEVNLIPASFKLSAKVSYTEAKRYMKEVSERVKEQLPVISSGINGADVSPSNANFTDADGKYFQFDEKAHQLTVEKFCTAFQDINKWVKAPENDPDEAGNWIDNDIENIHGNFVKLKETLYNITEISNTVIPTELHAREAPLDEIIQDTVIGLEKLQKVCDRNDN